MPCTLKADGNIVFRKNSLSRRRIELEPGQLFREKEGVVWEIVRGLSISHETPHYLLQRVDNPSRQKTVSLSALLDRNFYQPAGPRLVKDELEA